MTKQLDLTTPSVQAALHFAQEHGRAQMKAAGRTKPNAEDTEVLKAEFARLLWHVPVWDGGFLHGTIEQAWPNVERWRLDFHYDKAMLRMGTWPVAEKVAA